jgi:hypothetical protein
VRVVQLVGADGVSQELHRRADVDPVVGIVRLAPMDELHDRALGEAALLPPRVEVRLRPLSDEPLDLLEPAGRVKGGQPGQDREQVVSEAEQVDLLVQRQVLVLLRRPPLPNERKDDS